MFKALVTAGLATGAVLLGAPAAQAADTPGVAAPASCLTQFVSYVGGYGYRFTLPNNWVTVSGIDVTVNGSNVLVDTAWTIFVAKDYTFYVANGVVGFVLCVAGP